MSQTVSEKMKAEKELPEVKKVKTDFNNINLSKDEFEAKYRKERELEARMEVEKVRIEKELEKEFKKEQEAKKKLAEEKAKQQGNTETQEEV